MKLVVNADDLGMDKNKNMAVIQSLTEHYCTQASIVVNCGDATQEAVRMIKNNDLGDKIGLHINLTVGEPLTNDIKACKLYCKDGKFVYDPWLISMKKLIKVLWPRNIKAIRTELEAQIKAYLDYGFELRHIDSHNWIHLLLPVWLALKPLIKKYNIKTIRGIRPGMMQKRRWKFSLYYRIFNKVFLSSQEIRLPYASNIYEFTAIDYKLYENCKCTEVFTHPILLDGELIDNSRSYKKYSKETMSGNMNKIACHNKVDYNELHKKER